jgi:hypothetical protein
MFSVTGATPDALDLPTDIDCRRRDMPRPRTDNHHAPIDHTDNHHADNHHTDNHHTDNHHAPIDHTGSLRTGHADTGQAAGSAAGHPGVGASHAGTRRTADPDPDHARPRFPEHRLVVRTWPDPVLDNLGHDPRSSYVEQYWLSILGPSAILLLRRLANGLDARPDGFELDPAQWALELGLGAKGGRHGPFWRSVDRVCRFKAAQRNGEVLSVRRRMPPLTHRQIERLPEHLRRAHEAWARRQLDQPRRQTISRWPDDTRRLAG